MMSHNLFLYYYLESLEVIRTIRFIRKYFSDVGTTPLLKQLCSFCTLKDNRLNQLYFRDEEDPAIAFRPAVPILLICPQKTINK